MKIKLWLMNLSNCFLGLLIAHLFPKLWADFCLLKADKKFRIKSKQKEKEDINNCFESKPINTFFMEYWMQDIQTTIKIITIMIVKYIQYISTMKIKINHISQILIQFYQRIFQSMLMILILRMIDQLLGTITHLSKCIMILLYRN